MSESTNLINRNNRRLIIDRDVFSQEIVEDSSFIPQPIPASEIAKKYLLNILQNIFPPMKWVPRYRKRFLTGDIISGLTVSMIRLPQGLAYGILAGLDPINGVHLEFFLCIVYSILSTVPQNSTGTFSIIALMTGAAVDKNFPSNGTVDAAEMPEKVAFASALALVVGIIQVLFGILNLGAISILLAKPVVAGFTTASAIIVALAQATHLFGVPVTRFSGFASPLKTIVSIYQGIVGGVNMPAVLLSAGSIPFLYLSKLAELKYKDKLKGYPIPAELVLVVVTTAISFLIPTPNHVIVVGEVPSGLPTPAIPPVNKYFSSFISDAFSIAIVGYSTNLSLAKIFSTRHGFTWSANQEGFALGIAHIVSSFFTCFPGSAALARSSLQESAGGKTQLASFISASMMLAIILFIGPLFRTLPRCVLSCVVVVNLRSMFLQIKELPDLWRSSKKDFCIWMAAFLGVMLLGVDLGLIAGIMTLLLMLVRDQTTAKSITIESFKSSEIYVRSSGEEEPKIPFIRFTGPLNFASADGLEVPPGRSVLDLTQVTSFDFVGLTKLSGILKGREIAIVGCQKNLREEIEKRETFDTEKCYFVPTMIDAATLHT